MQQPKIIIIRKKKLNNMKFDSRIGYQKFWYINSYMTTAQLPCNAVYGKWMHVYNSFAS